MMRQSIELLQSVELDNSGGRRADREFGNRMILEYPGRRKRTKYTRVCKTSFLCRTLVDVAPFDDREFVR